MLAKKIVKRERTEHNLFEKRKITFPEN